MRSSSAFVWSIAVAMATAIAAVGPAMAEDAPVKGTVTLNGKPLASGRIFFHLGNDQFVGANIKNGSYTVDRVPTGKILRVSIEGKGVPEKYTSETMTPLGMEVSKNAPPGSYDLNLQ